MSGGAGGSELVRALGRVDLTALVVNVVVGSGIFGLPAVVIGLVGGWSPLAVLAAGAGIAVIVLCFAEVSSRFREAGGPYLYTRVAFGPFVGQQIGWITWLVRIASAAANANLFALYLAEIWDPFATDAGRVAIVTVLVGALAFVNVRGVRAGARMSTWFAIVKLLPLVGFVLVGAAFVRGDALAPMAGVGFGDWSQAMLLLVFAYGGFEAAMIPIGEARDPQRDAPFALLAGIGIVTLLYVAVQFVVVGTLPPDAEGSRPLASAARTFLGSPGAWLMTIAALVSIYGWFSAAMLSAPRLTYALAERGDFPRAFATVHERYRTPWVSIVLFATLSWMLAIVGSFAYNAELSALARLLTYAGTCGALIVLRRRATERPAFVAPLGPVLAAIGIAFCGLLIARMRVSDLLVFGVSGLLATATWLLARRGSRQ